MFPDFSYLYEHRTGVEAQFTYLCLCLWWLVFWIGIVAVALLVIGVVISPILVFYFGVDVFSSRQTEEKKTERRAKRRRRKDSKTDTYIKKLDLAAKGRELV